MAKAIDCRKGFIVLTLAFCQEGRVWTGECLELGTATYGRSLKQVHDELLELVDLHLNTLAIVGERERFFQTHNITVYETPPKVVTPSVSVDTETYVHAHRIPVGIPA